VNSTISIVNACDELVRLSTCCKSFSSSSFEETDDNGVCYVQSKSLCIALKLKCIKSTASDVN